MNEEARQERNRIRLKERHPWFADKLALVIKAA